jgi:hypothetical protein
MMQILICTYFIYIFPLDCMITFMLIYVVYFTIFLIIKNMAFGIEIINAGPKIQGSYGYFTYISNVNQFPIRLVMFTTSPVCV